MVDDGLLGDTQEGRGTRGGIRWVLNTTEKGIGNRLVATAFCEKGTIVHGVVHH